MKINFENEILITEKTFKPNLPGFLNLAGLVFVFNIRNKDKFMKINFERATTRVCSLLIAIFSFKCFLLRC